jgi:hypothetical protein
MAEGPTAVGSGFDVLASPGASFGLVGVFAPPGSDDDRPVEGDTVLLSDPEDADEDEDEEVPSRTRRSGDRGSSVLDDTYEDGDLWLE